MANILKVYNQEQLNKVPVNTDDQIQICFGDWFSPAEVTKCYKYPVLIRGDFYAVLYGNSTATLRENSTATLWGNSTATLWENSTATLWGNSQVLDRTCKSDGSSIKIQGKNARIVFCPKTIEEYMEFYGQDYDPNSDTVKLYKAVHKYADGSYHADWVRDFIYELGMIAESDYLDTDVREDCGHGIHMAYPEWCVMYANDWDDTAILELEVKKDEIIVPLGMPGKVRAPRVKVVREIPLEDCGIEGMQLAKRINRNKH